jgi:raffinose/stachyose/melibiose transport system permease protein
MKHNSKTSKTFSAVFLIVLGASFLFPLLWLLLTSFKGAREIYTNPIGLPDNWLFSNYADAVTHSSFVRHFINSMFYTTAGTFLVLLSVTLFSYATARMRFGLANKLQKYIQFGLVIPGGATLLGIYDILLKCNMKNTYIGLILVYAAMKIPMAAVIMHGFFRLLPFSLEESAAIDGAGTFTTFNKSILPMVTPAISTVSVITALDIWNEYTLAYILVDKDALKTLPVGIATFMTARGGNWGGMAAALFLAALPTIILYLIFSEKLEDALTVSSASK